MPVAKAEIELTCKGCDQVWVFTPEELADCAPALAEGEEIVSRELMACPKCNVEVDAEQAHVGHA